jgi:hypothetical protein
MKRAGATRIEPKSLRIAPKSHWIKDTKYPTRVASRAAETEQSIFTESAPAESAPCPRIPHNDLVGRRRGRGPGCLVARYLQKGHYYLLVLYGDV